MIFALRPCPHGAGAHIAQRADLHAELGDVVAARRLDDADQIELAVGQVGLLDFNAELFGDFARLGGALGRVFNVANSLFGPVHGDDEYRHDRILPLIVTRRPVANAMKRTRVRAPPNFNSFEIPISAPV